MGETYYLIPLGVG